MSQQEYIDALHTLIDGSVEKFNTNIPDIQQQIAMKIWGSCVEELQKYVKRVDGQA